MTETATPIDPIQPCPEKAAGCQYVGTRIQLSRHIRVHKKPVPPEARQHKIVKALKALADSALEAAIKHAGSEGEKAVHAHYARALYGLLTPDDST
jgi:hypothetical protein